VEFESLEELVNEYDVKHCCCAKTNNNPYFPSSNPKPLLFFISYKQSYEKWGHRLLRIKLSGLAPHDKDPRVR